MTEVTYPRPGPGNPWTQPQWRVYHRADTGVVGSPAGSERKVFADGSGPYIKRLSGARYIQGIYAADDTTWQSPTIAANGTAQWRIDRVVDELDEDGLISTVVLTGTPSATPVPPALTQTEGGVWQEHLGYARIKPGFTNITSSDAAVVDERRFMPVTATPVASDLYLPAAPRIGDEALYPDGARKRWTGTLWRVEHQPTIPWAGVVQADVLGRVIAGTSVGRYGIADGWLSGVCAVTSADVYTTSPGSVRPELPVAPVAIDRMPLGTWSIVRVDDVELSGVLRHTTASPLFPHCATATGGPVSTTLHVGDTISWAFRAPTS